MADSNVSISFGADASDFLDGVASVSAALKTLPTGVDQVAASIGKTSQTFSSFGAGASSALAKVGDASREAGASQQDAAQVDLATINGEIAAERAAFAEKKSLYGELTKLKILSADERLAATQAALDHEYSAERALLEKELQLGDLSVQSAPGHPEPNAGARHEICAAKPEDHVAVGRANRRDRWTTSWIRWRRRFRPASDRMIEKKETFQQAMLKLADTVLQKFIQMGVDIVANWAKSA